MRWPGCKATTSYTGESPLVSCEDHRYPETPVSSPLGSKVGNLHPLCAPPPFPAAAFRRATPSHPDPTGSGLDENTILYFTISNTSNSSTSSPP